MNLKAQSSQPGIASWLILSLAMTGALCLWSDRQTQTRTIQLEPTVKLTSKQANSF